VVFMKKRNDNMILAADVGGTKTLMGIFRQKKGKVKSLFEKEYKSQDYDSFENLVRGFLGDLEHEPKLTTADKFIGVACFGMAGLIEKSQDGKHFCKLTHPEKWPAVTETNLSNKLDGVPVYLLNDMIAIGYGISQLKKKDLAVLNPGIPKEGNRVVIAAGTGLGKVKLFWEDGEYHPSPSEGGHANFAPSYDEDNLQLELLGYLYKKIQGNVGFERLLSGEGLVNIYEFLRELGKYGQESAKLRERLDKMEKKDDHAQIISEAALAKTDSLCVKALDVFMSIYGSAAGDFALDDCAIGGVYIGGGIAPKNLEKMRDSTFMEAFQAKEKSIPKFREVNTEIPVKVILNTKVGLLGAAWRAAKS